MNLPNSLSCREARDDDAALEFALYADTRADELRAWGWTAEQGRAFLGMQFDAQNRGHRAAHPNAQKQIVEWKGEAVGRFVFDRTQVAWTLVDIALFEPYRGQGIGSRLLSVLLDEATTQEAHVQLHVWNGNRARRLYERLGFVVTSDNGAYSRMEWTPALVETETSR